MTPEVSKEFSCNEDIECFALGDVEPLSGLNLMRYSVTTVVPDSPHARETCIHIHFNSGSAGGEHDFPVKLAEELDEPLKVFNHVISNWDVRCGSSEKILLTNMRAGVTQR